MEMSKWGHLHPIEAQGEEQVKIEKKMSKWGHLQSVKHRVKDKSICERK